LPPYRVDRFDPNAKSWKHLKKIPGARVNYRRLAID